jgi:hypothetical protein
MTDSKQESLQPTEAERDNSGMIAQEELFKRLEERQEIGYTPLPSNVPDPQLKGSLWNATFSSGTMIGAFMNSANARKLDAGKPIPTFEEQLDNIPLAHIDKADVYVGRRIEDYPLITESLEKEERDRQLMANRPLASFAMGMLEQLAVEPINLFPFGEAFNLARGTSRLAKAIVSSGATGVTAGFAQEGFITRNELSRTAEESAYNILSNGVVGAALGGIGQGLTTRGRIKDVEQRKARAALQREVKDVYMESFQQLTPEGILTDEAIANLSPNVQKAMLSTPMNRLLRSEFGFSRWLSNQMYENGYTLNKNLKGEIKEQSIERLTRADYKKLDKTLIDYDNIYFESIGIQPGPFKLTREKLAGAGRQTRQEFDSNVWNVLSTEVPSNDGHVNRAASLIRNKVFEPYKQRLVKLGLLPEEFELRNATGYVSSIYLKDKIIEEGGRSARGDNTLPGTLHNGFKAIQEQVKAFKESPVYVEAVARIEKEKALLKETKLRDEIKEINERVKDLEAKLKEKIPPRLLDSDGKFWPILDDETLWGVVEQTVDNMLGDVSGKLVNPILQRIRAGTASPLKHRKLVVDQMDLKPWQSTDIPHLAHSYVRALSPTIHLNEFAVRNGAKDINDFKTQFEKKLTDEYNIKAAGKTGKEAQRLRKMKEKNMEDITASFELLEGIYGDGPNVMNSSAKKFWNNWMNWMATRLLGFMTLSSLPDAGLQVFKHGYYRFMHDGLMRATSDMRKISKRDLQGIGYAVNTILGSRLASYADTGGLTVNPGPFTRGMDVLTQSFGNLSLMNQWNDMMEAMAGHIGINRTLQTVHNVVEGKRVLQKEILRLNKLGLESKYFETIYEYTKNNKDTDGAIFANWGNWEITNSSQREALEQFQRSIAKEIDEIVIVPGLGDKPLLARKEFAGAPLGRMLFQFKTFLMASTNRVTTVAAQHSRDRETYEGVTAMLALGALSYMATSLAKGKDIDTSFDNMARESLDRSGLLGIFGEYKAITSKLTGVDVPTRYQSRDKIGALLGPSAGAFSDVANMIQSMIEVATGKKENVTEKDIDKLMRLMPLQNMATSLEIPKKLLKGTLAGLGGIETPELDEELKKLHFSK